MLRRDLEQTQNGVVSDRTVTGTVVETQTKLVTGISNAGDNVVNFCAIYTSVSG